MEINFSKKSVAEVVKEIRKESKLKQKDLALQINKSIDTIKSIETGRMNILANTLKEIANKNNFNIIIKKIE